jgi:OmpA-OmpF porin, OOP family
MLRKLLLGSFFLLPAIAVAQPLQGLYIGAGVGANFAGSMLSSQETTKVYTDPGPVGIAAIGWGFGNGLRAEI